MNAILQVGQPSEICSVFERTLVVNKSQQSLRHHNCLTQQGQTVGWGVLLEVRHLAESENGKIKFWF